MILQELSILMVENLNGIDTYTSNVYNPKGNQIVDEERIAGYSGVAHYKINTKKWNTGTYKALCDLLGQ